MRGQVARSAAAALVLVLLGGTGTGTSSAHTGWSVKGHVSISTFQSFGVGCVFSPICALFEATCNVDEGIWNDNEVDMSFKRLPGRTAGHRARFTWKARVEPIGPDGGPGKVAVFFMDNEREIGSGQGLYAPICEVPIGQTASRFELTHSFNVTIPTRAKWVVVGAFMAQDLDWELAGISH
jgi:hypothetical protein